ncbi:hypothetical protein [Marinobacter sp. SS21]|uniref:hypothetical protein n=1 Tax=Marinobacter sp. SS21 TaxID=2979460 RepID=UPI00232D26C6|nr:hypothetical protein [Marinobacter sp. SS21]MDC0662083.1 hypothetical protein [Marinobacter sp. SS21]
MKLRIPATITLSLMAASPSPLLAQDGQASALREPTRGFLLEHGFLSGSGNASVDLFTGSGDLTTGGGIRLGVPGAEIIFNADLSDSATNEALVKYGLPEFRVGQNRAVSWAALAGIAHIDSEDEDGNTRQDFTNFLFGATASLRVDSIRFTAQPQLIVADDNRDDTFFELGLGADFVLADTEVGRFRPLVEAVITTEDDADNTVVAGVRWIYHQRLTLDVVPLFYADGEFNSLPGAIRVNAAF